MKLSEYKGEQALDVLADLIEPIAVIMADSEITNLAAAGAPYVKFVRPAIKNHKQEVLTILAILDGEDPKTYAEKVNLLTLPVKLFEILDDPEAARLFQSLEQKNVTPSGSAMESTEDDAK